MDQKKVWNLIGESWSNLRQKPDKEVERIMKFADGKVLEIGCGNCKNFRAVDKKKLETGPIGIPQDKEYGGKLELYGVDFSKEMIKHAAKVMKRENIPVNLFVGDYKKLDFVDDYFDYVYSIASFHCVDKKDHEKSLKEMFRVMKPGARGFMSVWNRPLNENVKGGKLIPWKLGGETVERYYYFFETSELKKLLKDVGFKVKKCKTYEKESFTKGKKECILVEFVK